MRVNEASSEETPDRATASDGWTASSLTPMLTVNDAVVAIEFYRAAFNAVAQARFTSPTGHVDAQRFFVVDENTEAFNLSPKSLDGTTVRISLIVDDPDATAAQAVRAGASEIFPVADQPYGLRQGRVADPDGHHWLIGKPLDDRGSRPSVMIGSR